MIDFLLVWEARPRVRKSPARELLDSLGRRRVVLPTLSVCFEARRRPGLTLYAWGNDVPPMAASKRIRSDDEGISLLDGWMLPALGERPVANIEEARAHFGAGRSGAGEFLFLDIDADGNGRIVRNLLASVQLYSHVTPNLVILSTRASMIAGYLGEMRLNLDFARWVGTYSVPCTNDSLFRGVGCVPPGTTIAIEKGRPVISPPTHNVLAREDLQLGYVRDRRAFWDEVFENLIGLMRVIEATDLTIDFPLSGGRDSRLLLGLVLAAGHRERISRVFTNGPEFSPEVRAAQAVTHHLGLEHESVWSGTARAPSTAHVSHDLPLHLLVTEGEMSPIDLTPRTIPRDIFQLSGQESGLRNIAGARDVSSREAIARWLGSTVGRGDTCGVLRPEIAARNMEDVELFLERAASDGTPFEQIPTRHRVSFRGSRWVSRVWGVTNAVSFSPHIFRSEIVTLATYNSGARSRRLEEFHFEMLRRIDAKLVEIPFAGQRWDDELIDLAGTPISNPEPLTWPEGSTPFSQRPMFAALQANFESFKGFILTKGGPVLDEVLDKDRVRAFTVDQLKPGHVQPLWQLFQCSLLESIEDFSLLRTSSWRELGIPDFAAAELAPPAVPGTETIAA
jgi:hypothetical protein